VGDSAVDVAAAQGADLPVILTSFGYSDVPAAKLGADIVIDHFDALLPAIDRVAPGIFG
jgi:phosphoglycolate phosphatase